jgi:hypothetical protein
LPIQLGWSDEWTPQRIDERMLAGRTLVGLVVIAVILWVAALAINHVVRSDREPMLFKAIVIGAISVAAAIGVATMFFVVPAFWY